MASRALLALQPLVEAPTGLGAPATERGRLAARQPSADLLALAPRLLALGVVANASVEVSDGAANGARARAADAAQCAGLAVIGLGRPFSVIGSRLLGVVGRRAFGVFARRSSALGSPARLRLWAAPKALRVHPLLVLLLLLLPYPGAVHPALDGATAPRRQRQLLFDVVVGGARKRRIIGALRGRGIERPLAFGLLRRERHAGSGVRALPARASLAQLLDVVGQLFLDLFGLGSRELAVADGVLARGERGVRGRADRPPTRFFLVLLAFLALGH